MRYEIRTWLGKYEKWLLILYGKKSMRMQSELLDDFLAPYPRKSCLSRISGADVGDYLALLKSKAALKCGVTLAEHHHALHSAKKFGREISSIDRFWRYLINDCGLPLTNPAKPYLSTTDHTKILPRKQKYPSVAVFKKVYAQASEGLKRRLIAVIIGKEERNRIPPSWVLVSMNYACKNAGVKRFTMAELKSAVESGLWRELIKDYALGIGSDIEQLSKPERPIDLWTVGASSLWETNHTQASHSVASQQPQYDYYQDVT